MGKKTFQCGLLVEFPDGIARKIKLKDGGGSRFVNFDHIDMDFDSIRDQLVSRFNLESADDDSYSLHDFQGHPLDLSRYSNFLEYQQKNGLMFRSILLYLCIQHSEWMRINKNREKVPRAVTVKTTTKRTASNVVDDEDVEFIEEHPPKRKATTLAIANLHISSSTSSSLAFSNERHRRDFAMNQERAPYRSTARSNDGEEETFDDQIRYFYWRSLIAFDDLMKIPQNEGSKSVYDAAKSAASELESNGCNLQSFDFTSLIELQACIETIQRCLSRTFYERRRSTISGKEKTIFRQVKHVLDSFSHKIKRASHWSSQPRQCAENRSSIKLPRQRISNTKNVFDDASSDVSHSSVDDDALLRTATQAVKRFSKNIR